jgi:Uma2 family endonuclease
MTTTKRKLLTAEDLLALHSKGVKGELIRGVLAETVSTGVEHGKVTAKFTIKVGIFVEPRKLGTIVTSDSGVLIGRDPDIVREPDVAFTSAERMPLNERIRGYSEVPPDLVVEIASPGDTVRELFDKAQMWLRHGVRMVWVADPDTRTVDVYRQDGPTLTLTEEDTLDGDPVLAGFTLPVREVFE